MDEYETDMLNYSTMWDDYDYRKPFWENVNPHKPPSIIVAVTPPPLLSRELNITGFILPRCYDIRFLEGNLTRIFLSLVYIIVFIVGLPANAISLWVFLFRTKKKNPSSILMANLALSDLLFIVWLPLKIAYHLNGNNWIFGEPLCKVLVGFFYGNMYCSAIFIACISVQRYWGIVHPLSRKLTNRVTACICVGVWVLVWLITVPLYLYEQTVKILNLDITTCHDVANPHLLHLSLGYFLTMGIVGYVVPCVVCTVAYSLMLRALKHSVMKAGNTKQKKKSIVLMVIVLVMFLVCFTPSNVTLMVHYSLLAQNIENNMHALYVVALSLSSLNSCLDPFVYYFISEEFRDHVRNTLRCHSVRSARRMKGFLKIELRVQTCRIVSILPVFYLLRTRQQRERAVLVFCSALQLKPVKRTYWIIRKTGFNPPGDMDQNETDMLNYNTMWEGYDFGDEFWTNSTPPEYAPYVMFFVTAPPELSRKLNITGFILPRCYDIRFLEGNLTRVFLSLVYIIVFIVGLPANAISLWVFLFRTKKKNPSSILMANLALSDLLFIVWLPLKIAYHLNGNNWIFGEPLCKVLVGFFYGNMYCSTIFIACISVQRYWAIVHPLSRRLNNRVTVCVCVGVWVLVWLITVPLYLYEQTVKILNLDITTCHDVANPHLLHLSLGYFLTMGIVGYVVPCVVCTVAYSLMLRALKHSVMKAGNTKQKKKSIVLMIIVLVMFLVCFTPSNVTLMVHYSLLAQNIENNMHALYVVALSLSSLNSCLDPFVYYFISEEFRDHVRNTLRCHSVRSARRMKVAFRPIGFLKIELRVQTCRIVSILPVFYLLRTRQQRERAVLVFCSALQLKPVKRTYWIIRKTGFNPPGDMDQNETDMLNYNTMWEGYDFRDGFWTNSTPAEAERNVMFFVTAPPLLSRKLNNTGFILPRHYDIRFLQGNLTRVFLSLVYIIVFIVGLPANAISLWVFLFRTKKKNPTSILMANLALADLLFIVWLPLKIAYHLNGNNWIFGEPLCKVLVGFFYGNMYCSTIFIACISVQRYWAIVHPLSRKLNNRVTVCVCVGVWVLVWLITVPLYLYEQTVKLLNLDITTCHDVANPQLLHLFLGYFLTMGIVGYVVPCVVCTVAYSLMLRALKHSVMKAGNTKQKKKSIVLMVIVLVMFLVCFTPSNVTLMVHYSLLAQNIENNMHALYVVTLSLSSLNSCLDPFVYYFISEEFRDHVRNTLRCHSVRSARRMKVAFRPIVHSTSSS
ncbi:hypothetical protein NFI96_032240 [Prochilodus magdalenae]|nr:hypothetical protein NFI96_032240 [Prochilodus magdalenae]